MPQVKVRTKYWKLSNNLWLDRVGSETLQQAQARYVSNPSLAHATPPGVIKDGGFDVANTNELHGWVISPFNDSLSANADIYQNGTLIATIPATLARADVAEYYGLGSFNLFGFIWSVPQQYKIAGSTMRVTLAGRTENTENSPRIMESVATTTQATTTQAGTTTTVGGSTTTTVPVTTTQAVTTTIVTNSLAAAIGTPPVYNGFIDNGQTVQSDTNFLNIVILEYDAVNYRVRIENQGVNRFPDNGRSLKYQVNNLKYQDDLTGWYDITQPLYIQLFWANTSVPEYAWQAVGNENYFKAFSYIHFA